MTLGSTSTPHLLLARWGRDKETPERPVSLEFSLPGSFGWVPQCPQLLAPVLASPDRSEQLVVRGDLDGIGHEADARRTLERSP